MNLTNVALTDLQPLTHQSLNSTTPTGSSSASNFVSNVMPSSTLMPTPSDLSHLDRNEWLREFESAWAMTEALFEGLANDEAFYVRPPHGLRHPLVFYFIHPAVFYVNKLRHVGLWPNVRDEGEGEFEESFAVGVDEHSWDDVDRPESSWPELAVLRNYRHQTFEGIRKIIQEDEVFDSSSRVDETHPLWALAMGIEHERIHIETTSVLMRELKIEHVRPAPHFPSIYPSRANRSPTANAWVTVPGGPVELGKSESFTTFNWDNERGFKRENVATFEVQRQLVSNHEFSRFVAEGGYRQKDHWTEDGWNWREFRRRQHPMFWVKFDDDFKLRSIFEEIAMPWDWPVIVNYHEAKAYSQWLARKTGDDSLRLPREGEMQMLRKLLGFESHSLQRESWFGSEDREPHALFKNSNWNLKYGSEWPVDMQTTEGASVVGDVFGNLWQWCEDLFEPLDGFEPHPLYPDYSQPSFDHRHHLLLGGSFATSGSGTAPWTRNNFRAHFFQHAGFRLLRSRHA